MPMTLRQHQLNVKTASGLDILAGLWLIISPFALQYSSLTIAVWNNILAGIAVALLASSRTVGDGYKNASPSWANVAIGLWLIISPFILGYTLESIAYWNTLISGIVVVILALWSSLSTPKNV